MQTVDDIVLNDYLRVLFYGQSGTGKTTIWSSFPKPIISIVCSGGNKTGELRSIPLNLRNQIFSVTLERSEELKELLQHLKTETKFKTIVLDHVSGLQDLILKEILGLDEIPAQKSWGLATQQQYGQCTMQSKEYLRAILGMEMNSVIIGQERTFGGGDESSGMDSIVPSIGVAVAPSLAGWLNPACDYILQTFKRPVMNEVITKVAGKPVKTLVRGKGVEYCARCEPHDIFLTKFRMPIGSVAKIPDVIVNPTYDKINQIIIGKG